SEIREKKVDFARSPGTIPSSSRHAFFAQFYHPLVNRETTMNRCRIGIVSVGLALLVVLLGTRPALVKDKTDGKLDPAAKKLIGTFNYKVEQLVATCIITCDDGKWAVSAIFK